MNMPARLIIFVILGLFLSAPTALAEDASPTYPSVEGRYASVVVDADTLEILHARQLDELRYPASLTKVMTLFLLFDALEAGEVTMDTPMSVSRTAASASPTKLGVKAGSTITVADAIPALAVKSANDVSVVIAEHLSGSVEEFSQAMTDRARTLGMKNTVFMTPNGLPDPEQVTTARDMAKLASAVLRTYPDRYTHFGQKTFRYRGATYRNTNGLLHALDEVDGFKTGYTRDSGYNLMVSAEREGRRVIAIVLGGASGKARNQHMSDLLDRSFTQMGLAPLPKRVASVSVETAKTKAKATPASTPKVTKALSLRRSDGSQVRLTQTRLTKGEAIPAIDMVGNPDWAIRVGRFSTLPEARSQLGALFGIHPDLVKDNAFIQPVRTARGEAFESRFTQLSFEAAQTACQSLSHLASGCALIAPSR